MKLRFVLTALALGFSTLLIAPRANAQVGVYLNPVVTHIGISTPDSGPYAFLGENTTGRFFGGVDFGGYWDFYHQPGYALGVDIRDTTVHGNNAGLNTFSVAGRIAGNPVKYGLRPYAQLAIGSGRSKSEESIIHVTKFEWGIFAGVDYPLGKHVDFRVVELGYGTVTTISSEIERSNTSIPGANLFNISSGLVFRFGGK
jgi:hypothetical protein